MLDNLYQDSIESSGQFLRMALQQISRYNLPYNPITYSVWYEYASGKNQQLAEAIGQQPPTKLAVDTGRNTRLGNGSRVPARVPAVGGVGR